MIRVCHLTSKHSRYDTRIYKKECISLAKNGFLVTLIVNDKNEDETINNVEIISTNFIPKTIFERLILSPKKILANALKVDADIYHFHDPELLKISYTLKKKNKIVIFDSHENYYEQIKFKHYIPSVFRTFIARIYRFYETFIVKKIDVVIIPCTFNDGKNPFENRAKKTIIIDNYPKLDDFYDKYVPLSKKIIKICYTGALSCERGVINNIKAAFKAKIEIILAGKYISNKFKNQVMKLIEYKAVDYRGYVDKNEIFEIYQESSIGICTLLNKGQYLKSDNFATKVYEYMSMGLPVILSSTKYSEKILKEYRFGISVDPMNIDEIVTNIEYLINNPDILKIMGENGRKAISEKYNWSNEEFKLISLYKELLY